MDAGEDYTQLMSLATIYAYSKQQKKSIEEYLSINHDSQDRQVLKQLSTLISEEYDKLFVQKPKPEQPKVVKPTEPNTINKEREMYFEVLEKLKALIELKPDWLEKRIGRTSYEDELACLTRLRELEYNQGNSKYDTFFDYLKANHYIQDVLKCEKYIDQEIAWIKNRPKKPVKEDDLQAMIDSMQLEEEKAEPL